MNNVTYGLLKDYLDGRLNPQARHELEKQALDDPFLADALEGFSQTKRPADRELSLLQKSLEARIEQQHENRSIFHFTWQRLSVAMAAAVIFTLAGILFWMKADRNRKSRTKQHVEVSLSASGTGKDIYPQNGMDAFEEYLSKELKLIAGNKNVVIVFGFTVNPETSKPENIKIIKSAGAEIDQKAITALKNGPKWKAKSGEEIKVEIQFDN